MVHAGTLGKLTDRARRCVQRVQDRARAGRIEDHAIEYEQVATVGDAEQARESFRIDIAGEGDALAGEIDSIDHGRRVEMVPRDRRYDEVAVFEDDLGARVAARLHGNVVRMDRNRRGKITEVSKGAALSEHQIEKMARRRKIGALMPR